MVFFLNEPRGGMMPPNYRQNFVPPNQMWGQPPQYYGPQQQTDFYMPEPQLQQIFNQPSNFYGPNQPHPNLNPFFMQQPTMPPMNQQNQNQFQQQQPQQQQSPMGRFPDTFNTIMGHAGTIQNGVNMMRQLGSLLRLFR